MQRDPFLVNTLLPASRQLGARGRPPDRLACGYELVAYSFMIPGLGQCVSGHLIRAVGWLLCCTLLFVSSVIFLSSSVIASFLPFVMSVCALAAVVLWMLVDAYTLRRPDEGNATTTLQRVWKAVFFNMLVVGLGHVYVREWKRGVLFLVMLVGAILAAALLGTILPFEEWWIRRLIGTLLHTPIQVWAVTDVYKIAHRGTMHRVQWPRLLVGSVVAGACLSLLVILIVEGLCVDMWLVRGDGLAPTYVKGDLVVVSKTAYCFSSPARGDYVLIRFHGYKAQDREMVRVLRVGGIAGDRVDLRARRLVGAAGTVLVQWERRRVLDEMILDNSKDTATQGEDEAEYTIREGQCFVMGNEQAYDSRLCGPIDCTNIVGKVVRRLW
jgi:signal peptidase I